VFDPDDLALTHRLADPDPAATADDRRLTALAVSPGGELVAGAADANDDRRVRVWETASGRLVGALTVGGTDPIRLAWGPGGRTLFATGIGHLVRAKVVAPAAQAGPILHPRPVLAAAWAADGAGLVTLRDLPSAGETNRYRLSTPGRADEIPVPAHDLRRGRAGLAVDPRTGRMAVTTGRPDVRLWDPAAGLWPKYVADAQPSDPRFGPDGAVWAILNGERVEEFVPPGLARRARWSNAGARLMTGQSGLTGLAVGPGWVVASGRDGTVHLLGPDGKRRAGFDRRDDPAEAVAVAPAGDLAAAGTQAGLIRLFRLAGDSAAEEAPLPAHPAAVTALAFRPDGSLLASGSRDRTVRLWRRTAAGLELVAAVGGLSAPIRDLRFDPAGTRLLVLVADELAVRVWDLGRVEAEWAGLGL
jgi:WD40 repeat protein